MTVIAPRVDGPGQPEADPGLPTPEPTPLPDIDTVRALAERYSNWGRWGPDDELGTLNHIQASDVVAASGLVRSGRVFSYEPHPVNFRELQHNAATVAAKLRRIV